MKWEHGNYSIFRTPNAPIGAFGLENFFIFRGAYSKEFLHAIDMSDKFSRLVEFLRQNEYGNSYIEVPVIYFDIKDGVCELTRLHYKGWHGGRSLAVYDFTENFFSQNDNISHITIQGWHEKLDRLLYLGKGKRRSFIFSKDSDIRKLVHIFSRINLKASYVPFTWKKLE